jgi:hypothetical protein
VPAVLAADPGERVLVLEYLAGPGRHGERMTDYATALARLHAVGSPADAGTLPAWKAPDSADVEAFLGLAARLQIHVPPGLPEELHGLLGRLDPAGAHALLHGNPSPDNAVQGSDGIRFIDLEVAELGHGTAELAYLRIGWPTCWCATAVPEPMLSQAEAAYRSTWRSLTGTDLDGNMADACAGWLIRADALVKQADRGGSAHLMRLPAENWRWGIATARQRLLYRLTVVAELAAGEPALAGLVEVSRAMRDQIRRRWPGTRPAGRARQSSGALLTALATGLPRPGCRGPPRAA